MFPNHAASTGGTREITFPNEDVLRKLLYLRVMELAKKWGTRSASNWALVCNQPEMDDAIHLRIHKYDK